MIGRHDAASRLGRVAKPAISQPSTLACSIGVKRICDFYNLLSGWPRLSTVFLQRTTTAILYRVLSRDGQIAGFSLARPGKKASGIRGWLADWLTGSVRSTPYKVCPWSCTEYGGCTSMAVFHTLHSVLHPEVGNRERLGY